MALERVVSGSLRLVFDRSIVQIKCATPIWHSGVECQYLEEAGRS